jgi:superoxide dismutase, Fe-Mn family
MRLEPFPPGEAAGAMAEYSQVFFVALMRGLPECETLKGILRRTSSMEQRHQTSICEISTIHGPFELPKLPYSLDALEPHMSRETLELHHGKHHAGYVKKTNELLADHELKDESLEEIIRRADGALFNNAAQVWNHTFFWNCLTPNAKPKPEGPFASAIDRTYGSLEKFKEAFTEKAISLFGSGYVWLCQNPTGELEITACTNAHNPLTKSLENPLLTIDVWEHAYYVDYRNERKKFLDAFWKIVNWDFAEANFRTH